MYLTHRAPLAMALSAVALFAVPHVWFVFTWALVVACVVALDVWAAPSPRTLQLERDRLESVHLGESTTSAVTVTNTGTRRVRGALRDVWLPSAGVDPRPGTDSIALNLEPQQKAELRIELQPTRRGFRRTDLACVRSRGPLGLAGRQQNREVPGVVQVLPAFASRRELPSRLAQLREIEGNSRVRTFGRGSEFDSLRAYVPGDDVRSIDWRATARQRAPVVRTWRPERDRQVAILLDTSRLSAGRLGDTTRLDAGMDACLMLAALASRAGDNVRWMAGARTIEAEVSLSGSTQQRGLRPLLTAMSTLESQLLEADWRAVTQHLLATTRPGALIVLVTPLSPAAFEDGLLPQLPALAARRRVVVASVADPELEALRHQRDETRHVYAAAAAERTLIRTDYLTDVMERLGVEVLNLQADRLPGALADLYLRLKRDGKL